VLLEQWLQEGPEPQPVQTQTIDPGHGSVAASS
jgi:hypothetical protein